MIVKPLFHALIFLFYSLVVPIFFFNVKVKESIKKRKKKEIPKTDTTQGKKIKKQTKNIIKTDYSK